MAEIRIYEDITQDTLERVASELAAIPDGEQVDLYIASPGGELLTAMAIIDLLKSKHAFTRATIVGYAASAAAIIALSCDYVRMSPLGLLLIHSAWVDYADVDECEDEGIRRCNDYQLSIIQQRNPSLGKELFKQDNWYSADEALSLGLVDEVYSNETDYSAACKVYAARLNHNNKKEHVMSKKVIKAAEIPVEEVVEQAVEEKEEVKEEAVEEQPVEKKTLEDVVEALSMKIRELEDRVERLEGEKKEEVVVEAACGDSDEDEQRQARLRAMMERIARPQARVAIGEVEPVKQPVKVDSKKFAKFLNV